MASMPQSKSDVYIIKKWILTNTISVRCKPQKQECFKFNNFFRWRWFSEKIDVLLIKIKCLDFYHNKP